METTSLSSPESGALWRMRKASPSDEKFLANLELQLFGEARVHGHVTASRAIDFPDGDSFQNASSTPSTWTRLARAA
jgi:hypothetical protein